MSEVVIELDPDLYGRCKLSTCQCLKPGATWLGRACPNWTPIPGRMSARDFAIWTAEKAT